MKKPHFLKACPTEFLFNKNTSKKPLGFGFSVLGERPHLSPSVFGSLFRGDIYLGGPGSSSLGSAHPRRPRVLLGPKAEPWRVARGPRTKPFCGLRNASRPGLPSSSLEIKRVSFNAVLSEKDYFFLEVIFLKTVPPCESRSGGGSLGGCVLAPHSPASSRAPGARSTCAERSLAAACPVCEAVPREQTLQAVDFGLDLVESAPRAETPTKTSSQKEGRRRNSREPPAAEGGGQADRPPLRGRARWPSLGLATAARTSSTCLGQVFEERQLQKAPDPSSPL